MEQTVYIDIFFLINFTMDFLCFFLVSKLLSTRLVTKRAVLASALGGVYACASLFVYLTGVTAVIVDILACVAMCAVAMKPKGSFSGIFGFSVVYTAVSMVLGGMMTALFSFFNKMGLDKVMGDEGDSDGISVWLFVLLAIISGAAALFGGRFFKKKSSRHEGRVEISYKGKTTYLKAMCDSGNLLVDPISGKPCIIADIAAMEKILPEGMSELLKSDRTELLGAEDMKRVRVVPARTVSGGGMLYAIKADVIRIDMGKGWRETDALVALCTIGDNAQGAEALIPSSLAFGIT